MAKTRNIWLFVATIMLLVSALGFTLSVKTSKVNAETEQLWTASENWDTTTDGEYKVAAGNSLSTLTYNGTMGKVSSVKFDFTYTTNTLAGDHWVGVCINGYWHQLYLNASHETALPYLSIFLLDGSLWASWDNSRIPREKMPHNTKNTFEIKLNENGFEFYVNDELTYNLDGYTHSNVTSLIIGTRDVEMTIDNPVVTTEAKNPDAEWVSNGKFTEENGVYTAHKTGLSASLKYNGDVENVNCVSFEFYYKNDVAAGDHCVGWKVGNYRFKIYINATYGVKPYVALNDGKSEESSIRFDVIEAETWNTAKLILDEGSASFYVCGRLVWETSVNLQNLNEVEIYSYAVESQIRTPMAENIVVKKLDLEFNSLGSVENMLCENGSLSYDSGNLVASINGEGFALYTPKIEVAKGHKYSVKLGVRNTFVVRMKNDSAATALKLYFLVKGDEDYIDSQSKTFDIIPNSDYTTYYFNLSDVVDCDCWQSNSKLKM